MAAEYEIVERLIGDTKTEFGVSHRLVDRLRGKYASGPHLPNGNPEFGWRQFEATPLQHEAADAIEDAAATIVALAEALETAAARFDRFERRLPELASGTQRAEMAIYAGQCADECRKVTSRLKGDSHAG